MDNILKQQENVDLNEDNIKDITKGKCNIVVYHEIPKYNSVDDLLGEFGACIILYETREDFGHWVVLMKIGDNQLEFFDSYGFQMDTELKYAVYDNTPYLSNLVSKSSYDLKQNTVRLQTMAEEVNTCGRWASTRIVMRDMPLDKFINIFKRNANFQPDWYVSALTYLYTFNE